jgi:hypothetical protein
MRIGLQSNNREYPMSSMVLGMFAVSAMQQRQRQRSSALDSCDGVAMRRVGAVCVAAMLLLGGCGGKSPISSPVAGETPDGTVDMSQVQAAFIGSGGGGSGTLVFRGQAYPFTVGGLGIGGIGASTIEAAGEVYHLHNVAQFPGAYAQGRYGFVVGTTSGGDLWLQNESGVIMHLHAKRTGLMLSLGGDAVVISMNQ